MNEAIPYGRSINDTHVLGCELENRFQEAADIGVVWRGDHRCRGEEHQGSHLTHLSQPLPE
jgi:hypothetical protein